MTRIGLRQYALKLARAAAERSEDPYLQVGAVLVRPDKTIAATGYNGPPPGIDVDWEDRDARRGKMIHAEANALRYVAPHEVEAVVTSVMPCLECVRAIASYGIRLVFYGDELPPEYHDRDAVLALAGEFGITVYKVEET